jgi:hypothetical protein
MARTRKPKVRRGGDKGGSKKPKTRGVKLELRLDAVADLIASGLTRMQVIRFCHEQWDLSEAQAKEYIARVYAAWRAEGEATRNDARERARRRLQHLSCRAEAGKDFRAAVQAESQLSKIEGTEWKPEFDRLGDGADGKRDITIVWPPPPEGVEPGPAGPAPVRAAG